MANEKSNKVVCPVCNATSGQAGFGEEKTRRIMRTPMPLDMDPVIVQRRSQARAIRQQNALR